MGADATVVVHLALFLGAMGAEELTGAAIIPEPLARATLLIVAGLLEIAALGWVSFLVLCGLAWRAPGAKA